LKSHDGILHFEFQDLTELGISDKTLKSAIFRGSKCWTFVSDPDDGRKVLVPWGGMPERWQKAAEAKYGDPAAYMAESAIKQYITPDYEARKYYNDYTLPSGNKLPSKKIDIYVAGVEFLNMIIRVCADKNKLKKIAKTKKEFYEQAVKYIAKNDIKLPNSIQKLYAKVRIYKENGFESLIETHKFGNINSKKINADAQEWVIAQYSMPTTTLPHLHVKYNIEAENKGWKPLKSQMALYTYLNKAEVMQQWFLGRYGEFKFKEKYGYTLKTMLPTMRDALWYGDGTKLNYYYQYTDEKGKLQVGTMYVYEVVDAYSEVLLGYSVGKSEDYQLQYEAYKMAINVSGQKPYEIRYDNQGGHKKIKDSFLSKLSHVGFACQPYNAKSKTIESIFGRFQSQFLRQDWFFTGQNVTAKKLDSKHNREFIYQNKHLLPTQSEVIAIYEKRRKEWNESKHPKAEQTRLERYLSSENPKAEPVDMLQKIELFWLTTAKTTTYYTSGITLTLGKNKYEYEVLKNGMPDIDFRQKNIDNQFFIKYDPTDLSHIRLYKKTAIGLEFIAGAEPRIVVHRAVQDYTECERALISDLLGVRDAEVKRAKKQHKERAERTGISIYNQMAGYGIESYAELLKKESDIIEDAAEYSALINI
jgi:hypothetical protein